jgi:hypothetical protein
MIHPYKLGLTWVFDDKRFDLVQEPFVGITNRVIDAVLSRKGFSIYKPFTLMFSPTFLPDYDAKFSLKTTLASKSAWYWSDELGVEFWLCPVINHYFSEIPKTIYTKVIPYVYGWKNNSLATSVIAGVMAA